MTQQNTKFHSGFVAILGKPNVGKSSILNWLVGEKVAIVSMKAQTTRTKMLGVVHGENAQAVFIDTPGIFNPRNKLGEYMIKSVESAKDDVDAVLVVADGGYIGNGDRKIFDDVLKMKCPKILAVNKSDIVPPEKLMPALNELNGLGFDEIIVVSAVTGDNMDYLKSRIFSLLPEGPKYFPDDMITDRPERDMCAEIIREKALLLLREEIPHGIGIEMMSIEKVSPKMYEIHATIYTERASHKSIIIGKQGSMLKRIGSMAREDIEKLLDAKVMLKLWVKVREGWRDNKGDLAILGYED